MKINMFQDERSAHRIVGVSRPVLQLSYSHMQPIGWNDIAVPRRAPIRETKSLNIGMPLAIRYEELVIVKVQPSQVAQCLKELAVKCSDPRNKRRKMHLLGN